MKGGVMPDCTAVRLVRILVRLPRLCWWIITATVAAQRALRPPCSLDARAAWLHHQAGCALPLLGIELNVMGQPPDAGLLVCNHLGYLDILVLAALRPAVFVAKSEVADWPVMGRLARMAGTLFVDRQRRLRTRHTADEVDGALRSGNLVVLFPEGTSSDGAAVLPFHSALLEPARLPGVSVHAAHLSYEVTDGSVADEVCYWRDMTLLPHLLNLLGKKRILARVRFGRWTGPATDRKALASGLRELVCGLQRD
jgi:lyso-ornithine lipid O-acyltransferase